MKQQSRLAIAFVVVFGPWLGNSSGAALAQGQKANIILIVSEDFGRDDAAVYAGSVGHGTPTPNPNRHCRCESDAKEML